MCVHTLQSVRVCEKSENTLGDLALSFSLVGPGDHQEAWVPSEPSLLAQCMALKKVRVGDHNQVFMIMQASSLVCIA